MLLLGSDNLKDRNKGLQCIFGVYTVIVNVEKTKIIMQNVGYKGLERTEACILNSKGF